MGFSEPLTGKRPNEDVVLVSHPCCFRDVFEAERGKAESKANLVGELTRPFGVRV